MSYTNVYPSRINWENEPSIASPINATNLNKIDYAVYEHDQTLETWDVTKANQSDLLLSVKSIDYDTTTGVFVFTWQNGTTKTVDLNIEKIPVSFSMSPQGVITMTTEDGTQYTADVGSLIKTYTFTDSTEIDFTVTTDASGNKTVTAALKDGSIVGTKLEPNYLANCQSAANSASASKTAAEGSAEDSEAWAVGTRDGVPVPSSDPAYENNAKYWAEHTSASLAGLTDTDITTPTNGQVLTYDGSKWINDDPSAGGGSTIKVTTSESSLFGRTVTITCGTYTASGTFSNSGEVEFTGVTATGTFTIATSTSGGTSVSKTLSVPYFGNYSTTITLFSATITATFPADRGATCTCDGVTASTSPYTFTVGAAGTYPVQTTLDGASKSVSVPITTDGQSESVTLSYGTINLTFSDEFRGLTITCGLNGTTITKQAPSSGNTMAFYPPTTGEWTISGTYSGVTYSTSATVVNLGTAVSALLQTVPNGSTATPTDSIQTWLKCATINDKSYTTLNEVLADTDTFTVLLQDSNACDYMARSTTWSTTICADADAMARIGKYDYCSCALLENSTWASAIANSTYWDSVLKGLVPIMTSDTTPSGTIFYSGNRGNGYDAYRAFDGTASDGWNNDGSNYYIHVGNYIGYTFDEPIEVYKCMSCLGYYDRAFNIAGKIQASNDGTNWTDLTEIFNTSCNSTNTWTETVFTKNVGEYSSYRWICTTAPTHGYYGGFNLQFYGRHEAQTNIIHSAASDTLYYIDGTNQTIGTTDTSGVGTVDWSNVPVGNLTIYSSVANEPTDLSSAYSKTVRITPNTVEVYVMPDNALYWWGYTLMASSSTQGWTSTYGLVAATENTNNVYITGVSGGTICSYSSLQKYTASKFHAIYQATNVIGEGLIMQACPNKNRDSNNGQIYNGLTTLQHNEFALTDASIPCYFEIEAQGARAGYFYAAWYE